MCASVTRDIADGAVTAVRVIGTFTSARIHAAHDRRAEQILHVQDLEGVTRREHARKVDGNGIELVPIEDRQVRS